MSSGRPFRLVLQAICLLDILSAFLFVTASPIPLPLPLLAADYSNSLSLVSVNRSAPQITSGKIDSLQNHRPSKRSDFLTELLGYYGAASDQADILSQLSTAEDGDSSALQQQYASALSSYNSNVSSFQASLAKAVSDKGLAYYDKTDDLEIVLKNFVNLNKNVLSITADYVGKIPIVGPILEPLIYDLKCLIDGILDSLEDCLDKTINSLGPLFQSIFGKDPTCPNGGKILGLCL